MTGLSDESLRFGEELATVTLGIDALDRRLRNAQDEMDGLVVINMGWKKELSLKIMPRRMPRWPNWPRRPSLCLNRTAGCIICKHASPWTASVPSAKASSPS
mgnify:CR=1 FL=1